ncbi:MAG: CocE/NonD family hydrolase [Pyrinomonadaceae bacterium]
MNTSLRLARLYSLYLLLSLLFLAGLTHAQNQPTAPQIPADVAVEKNVMIKMRDGVRLAADVYLPAKNGVALADKLPVILERTPYNKEAPGTVREAVWFTQHGYAVVKADVRGRFHSEGLWRMMLDDGRDGYDTIEWIAQQPWSNGKTGMVGTSYPGGTQHAAAEMNPPHLTTLIPVDALSNVGIAGFRHSGAFELRFVNWIYNIAGPDAKEGLDDTVIGAALKQNAANIKQFIWTLPVKRGTTVFKYAPEYEDWLVEAMQHSDYDDYWKQIGYSVIDNTKNYADIPVYHVTGWYDSWTRQVWMNWQALSKTKRAPQRLIIGPWTHGGEGRNVAGEIEFPREAALSFNEWRLRWFEHWLKGVDNGADRVAPVRLFIMGGGDGRKSEAGRLQHGGVWRDEQEFPLARTKFTPYYLQPDMSLSATKAQAAQSATTYRFDPANPVPTLGGNISSHTGLMDQGGMDQRCRPNVVGCKDTLPLSVRNDVLVFQTPPLAEDMEVTGPVEVKLWVTSSALDTDFTAKLVDVYQPNPDFPAGYELNIGDSIIRTRYRDSLAQAKLMKPGALYQVTITLYPTANLFKRGHRLRLDISSSNFPRFDINPNTGDPLQQQRRQMTADNTVYHDRAHPSYIMLPIIPRQ